MSSEIHKHIEQSIEKSKNLFNAEVIDFPSEKKLYHSENLKKNSNNFWKISDKSNDDQLKAVIGICFMFGTLILLGLYSNLF